VACALIKIKGKRASRIVVNCARVERLAVVASQNLAGFRIDQVYPRADEAGYRLIGIVVAFCRIVGNPTLNAKTGIRTTIEKSAHSKWPRPQPRRCPGATRFGQGRIPWNARLWMHRLARRVLDMDQRYQKDSEALGGKTTSPRGPWLGGPRDRT